MKVVYIKKEMFLEKMEKSKKIGEGACSKIVEFDENNLLKITKDDNIDNVKKIIDRKNNVKKTKLTEGIVYVDDKFMGYLIFKHKNMIDLFTYLNENKITDKDIINIMEQVKEKYGELLENNIYTSDVSSSNILINPTTKEVQIIDFEDHFTECLDEENISLKSEITRKVKNLEMELNFYKIRSK